MTKDQMEAQARKRASVILRVRSGQMTATEGAKELGISRKSYYKWEKKALTALLESLQDQPTGRSAAEIDPEKERQEKDIERLEQENATLRARFAIQKAIFQAEKDKKKGLKKPKRS